MDLKIGGKERINFESLHIFLYISTMSLKKIKKILYLCLADVDCSSREKELVKQLEEQCRARKPKSKWR